MIQWRSIQHGDEAAIVAVFIASVHQVARRDYPPEQLAAWAPETGIDPVAWCAPLFQDDTLVAVSAGRIAYGVGVFQGAGLPGSAGEHCGTGWCQDR